MAFGHGGKREGGGRKKGSVNTVSAIGQMIRLRVAQELGVKYFEKFIKKKLRSNNWRESLWAFEQVYGKAIQTNKITGGLSISDYDLSELTDEQLKQLESILTAASFSSGEGGET